MSKFLARLRAARKAGAMPRTVPVAEAKAVPPEPVLVLPPPRVVPERVFAPPSPCAACGEPSAMFLRDHPVTTKDPATGEIRRRLGDFCSRECVGVEEGR